MPSPLPIDPLLPHITDRLLTERRLVLCAPPGAGKTTRVPPALLDRLPAGQVLVLEPRRLAAHLSAARVAEERGTALGDEVGVQVRQGSVCGPHTRLRYVTEGVLLRRLLAEPALPGVAAVLFDEFHERHLLGDLALGLLLRLQRGPRPELLLGVMSATLAGDSVARYLGGAPVVESMGRSFAVTVRYLDEPSDRPLQDEVRGALLRLLRDAPPGDVLVFLPGAGEIRRCEEALAEVAAQRGLDVLPLHGDMPLPAQQQAVRPRRPGDRRRVILATNVAETSVTIDGVTAVIDSGLARVAAHSPWSGLPTLRVQRICRAAAAQRAGRAGRTQPGECLRLYTRADHDSRPAFEAPEIRRLDLTEAVLLLRATGLRAEELELLDPPPQPALAAAEQLLRRLGALDERGELTALGARLARLPLHPRQARLLLKGEELGVAQGAAVLAALLGERDLRLGRRYGGGAAEEPSGPSDLLALLDAYAEAQRLRFDPGRLRAAGIDPQVAQAARRLAADLTPHAPDRARERRQADARDTALLQAILAAYPDRVARRRAPRSDEVLLCGGGSAQLSRDSAVRDALFLVAVDVEERGTGGRTLVRLASAIEPDWLLDLPGAPLRETEEPAWNAQAGRVERVRRLLYEELLLDESRGPGDGTDPAHGALLLAAARAAGPRALGDEGELERLRARLAFVATHCPETGLQPLPPDAFERALAALCPGRTSLAELREVPLQSAVLSACGLAGAERLLGQLAPDHVVLPGGRRVRVAYAEDRPPWIAARLQDFFGMARGPAVAGGRVPLVLHLLAPNQRPVQVTTDLEGFWTRHYPAVRRELCRRYPRHPWPEDPRTAPPTGPRRTS